MGPRVPSGRDVNLLAIDTSTTHAALAVVSLGVGSVSVASPDPAARHGRALVPAIRALLADAGLAPSDLGGLVVGLGPGSYTGLRIGLTAAKTLAYALGTPLVGFDSLDVVARNAPPDALRVHAIGDAQRGDLYLAAFHRERSGGPLVRLEPTQVVPLDRWAAELPLETYVLGPALTVPRLADALPGHARRPVGDDDQWPNPVHLAAIAREVWLSGRRDDPWFLEPVYLRRSAAEEQWDRLQPPAIGTGGSADP